MKLKSLVSSFAVFAALFLTLQARIAHAETSTIDPEDPGDIVGMVFDYGVDQDPRPNWYVCNTWSPDGRFLGRATWEILGPGEQDGTALVNVTIDMGRKGIVKVSQATLPVAAISPDAFDLLHDDDHMVATALDSDNVKGVFNGHRVHSASYRCINETKPDDSFFFCRYCIWIFR